MGDFISSLLKVIFPARCLFCKSFGSYFCSKCQSLLTIEKPLICPVCKKNAFDGLTHFSCRKRLTLDGFYFFADYKNTLPQIIRRLKYQPFLSAAIKEIVEKLYLFSSFKETNHSLAFEKFISLNPVVIPVPLSSARFKWRGYNHAGEIGKYLANLWQVSFLQNILFRIKNTKPQAKLNFKEREENIKSAFAVDKKASIPEKIVLIDDVWTTGATLTECGKTLKQNGVKEVWAVTLTR